MGYYKMNRRSRRNRKNLRGYSHMDRNTICLIRDSRFYRDEFALITKIKEVASKVKKVASRNSGKIVAALMAVVGIIIAANAANSKGELKALEGKGVKALNVAESLISSDISAAGSMKDIMEARNAPASPALPGLGRLDKILMAIDKVITRIKIELLMFFKNRAHDLARNLGSGEPTSADFA